MLAENTSHDGKPGHESNAYFIGKDLFDITKDRMQAYLENVDGEVSFEVPILQDVYGLTALDICLGIHKPVHHPRDFFAKSTEKVDKDSKSAQNLLLANLIFESIKDYCCLHHSH